MMSSYDQQGYGELQLNRAGTHLLVYDHELHVGGFDHKEMKVMVYKLNEGKMSVESASTLTIPGNLAGNFRKGAADFTYEPGEIDYNQRQVLVETPAYGSPTPRLMREYTTNNGSVLLGTMSYGDVRRGMDQHSYIAAQDQNDTLTHIDGNNANQYYTWTGADNTFVHSGRLPVNTIRLHYPAAQTTYVRTIGKKEYEVKDHLGNVHAVVLDYKNVSSWDNTNDIPEGHNAAIVTLNDYYPFGMVMDGRELSTDGYRFGFNGMERDDEVNGSGNSLDFGARIYSPRTGVWLSRDPKWRDFPNQSPYSAFNSNPVLYADPTGESGEVTIDKETKTITITSHMVFYGGSATPELAKSTASDVENAWNESCYSVSIDGVDYNVQFNVTAEHKADLTPDEIKNNTDIKNNYIRVEEGNGRNISYMDDAGSNSGYFLVKNIKKDGSTTEGHEMGHGFGLEHPTETDLRGKGQPGIMYPRGTLVDEKYRYPSWKKSGYEGLNPESRKVTQQDVNNLGLDKLSYDKDGKADLGKITNKYHEDETPPSSSQN